jgi:hypothetical protein
MSQNLEAAMHSETRPSWWDLHLRAARGEQLSPAEREEYEAAIAQQDHSPRSKSDLAELKRLRMLVESLTDENTLLRSRVDGLLQEIRLLERNLNRETKELLGVSE